MISHVAQRLFSLFKRSLVLALALWLSLGVRWVFAAMSSTNYLVQWDALSAGANDVQGSGSYTLRSSVDFGGSSDGLTSSSYALDGGYRGGIFDPVVGFQLFSQDISTQVAAISATASTVDVTSVAGFSVGDRVLLVQDEGGSQVSAMGKISAIVGSTLSVDVFSGGSPTIDGVGGDYVYKMTADGTTLPLGTPLPSLVVTGVIGWEGTADVQTGYSVYVMEDENLTNVALDEIPDVADGEVTAGSSEYGAFSSDTSLAGSTFDTQDTAITQAPQLVASHAGVTFYERDFVTLKLAVSSTQAGGSYAQNLYVLFAGNY